MGCQGTWVPIRPDASLNESNVPSQPRNGKQAATEGAPAPQPATQGSLERRGIGHAENAGKVDGGERYPLLLLLLVGLAEHDVHVRADVAEYAIPFASLDGEAPFRTFAFQPADQQIFPPRKFILVDTDQFGLSLPVAADGDSFLYPSGMFPVDNRVCLQEEAEPVAGPDRIRVERPRLGRGPRRLIGKERPVRYCCGLDKNGVGLLRFLMPVQKAVLLFLPFQSFEPPPQNLMQFVGAQKSPLRRISRQCYQAKVQHRKTPGWMWAVAPATSRARALPDGLRRSGGGPSAGRDGIPPP